MKLRSVIEIAHRAFFEKTASGPGEVEWLLVDRGDCIVVAYRGTEFLKGKWFKDVMRNICSLIPWKLKSIGWGGAGYMLGARNSVEDLVQRLYESGVNHNKQVIMCGHSMGAALSFYAALILHNHNIPIRAWVGAGTPNCAFRRRVVMPFKSYNLRYGSDIVSSYPPRLFGFDQPFYVTNLGDTSFFNFGNYKHHNLGLYYDNVPDVEV